MRLGWPLKSVETRWITPGVSILLRVSYSISQHGVDSCLRLTLEVVHNIKESVVDIGLVYKTDLDLIKIAECILVKRKSQP
jgi:hypothetical protein